MKNLLKEVGELFSWIAALLYVFVEAGHEGDLKGGYQTAYDLMFLTVVCSVVLMVMAVMFNLPSIIAA